MNLKSLLPLFLLPFTTLAEVTDLAIIETTQGNITVELYGKKCPKNVAAFKDQVRKQVYTGSSFHSQGEWYIFGGKPGTQAAKQMGSSGNFSAEKAPPPEFNLAPRKGSLTMGRTAGSCNPEMNSNSTQFTLSFAENPNPSAQQEYTIIGYISDGMEVVEKLSSLIDKPDAPKDATRIKRIRVVSPSAASASAPAFPSGAGR